MHSFFQETNTQELKYWHHSLQIFVPLLFSICNAKKQESAEICYWEQHLKGQLHFGDAP